MSPHIDLLVEYTISTAAVRNYDVIGPCGQIGRDYNLTQFGVIWPNSSGNPHCTHHRHHHYLHYYRRHLHPHQHLIISHTSARVLARGDNPRWQDIVALVTSSKAFFHLRHIAVSTFYCSIVPLGQLSDGTSTSMFVFADVAHLLRLL